VNTRLTTQIREEEVVLNTRRPNRIWLSIVGITLLLGALACLAGGAAATETPQPTQTARVVYLAPPTNTPEPTAAPTVAPTARPYCDKADVLRWLTIVKPPVDGLAQVSSGLSDSNAQAAALQNPTPYLAQAKESEYVIGNSDPPPCAQIADSYLVTTFGGWRAYWEYGGSGDISQANTKLNEAGTALGLFNTVGENPFCPRRIQSIGESPVVPSTANESRRPLPAAPGISE
jgi:hypothetical protein